MSFPGAKWIICLARSLTVLEKSPMHSIKNNLWKISFSFLIDRRLNERRFLYEKIGGESETCPANYGTRKSIFLKKNQENNKQKMAKLKVPSHPRSSGGRGRTTAAWTPPSP